MYKKPSHIHTEAPWFVAMWYLNKPVVYLSAITASIGGVCLFKDHKSGPPYDRSVRADGKVVVVTGANTGIGREAVYQLANRGAKVFMACRDMKKCEQVRKDIVLETRNKFVYCRPCDLTSLRSVADFVARFKSEEPYLDVLVNNAGVMAQERSVTKDGFELDFGVNHLGHFLLTALLLDVLKKTGDSRVIIVSCAAYAKGTINKEDLNWEKDYDPQKAYNQSKLANVLFGRELAKRLLETDVSVSVVDPGLVDSNITRHMPMSKSITRFFIYPIFWPFMKNPNMGAQCIIHAALDSKMKKVTGDYYLNMEKVEVSQQAQDFELAGWLWRLSEKWTKLKEYQKEVVTAG